MDKDKEFNKQLSPKEAWTVIHFLLSYVNWSEGKIFKIIEDKHHER